MVQDIRTFPDSGVISHCSIFKRLISLLLQANMATARHTKTDTVSPNAAALTVKR
jgi:hypothetical protein